MTWSAAGVQSGTDTDLSGLTSVTGTTTTTVGNVTIYETTSDLEVTGTLSMDKLTEQLLVGSTSADALNVSSGTFIVGSEDTSSFGHGRQDISPLQTAIIFAKSGPGCCDSGPFTIGASGRLELYGAAINLNGCIDVDGEVKIRNSVIYSHNDDGNTRWRSNADPADYDIDGLITYGIQFDSLADGTFGKFINFLPLDKGIPIENALGTTGAVREWRSMPDNTYAADAVMNNWQGLKDVIITLHEAGSRIVIVPDSTTSTTAHGGRLRHEFTVSAFDVLNQPIEDVLVYLEDHDNGNRITTTTAGGNISQGDQVLTPLTGAAGITSLQTFMTAMFYRTSSSGGDLTSPNGLERTDCRAKPYSVLCSISGSTGVTGTFGSSNNSLPDLLLGTRFILNGSTSNDTQTWETTEDWTGGGGGDADRLSSNSTDETENTMDMIVLGEDRYDLYLGGYEHLPYKFTDAVMKGLVQTDLVATMLEDSGITETNRSAVDAYTFLNDLEKFYDAVKNYQIDSANFTKPSTGTPIATAAGSTIDLGSLDLVLDGSASQAFDFDTDTITILPAVPSDTYRVGATEAVSTGEDDKITLNFPAGSADGDVAYIGVGHAESEDNAWNTPSGWTIPTGLTEVQTGGTPVSTPGVSVFRRVLSSDSGSVTITNVGTNVSGIVAQMIVYRNVDNTTPEDVAPVTASGATGDPNPGSITPVNNGSMILAFAFQDHGDQTSPTQPSGYTAILDTATTDGAGTGES